HYWEICRTARRRSVTPDYVVDRAAVLLATIEERRRTDLYRILGVPPLSSGETIREHWLELAKRHHPDVGGDGARFRQAQQAYEILRDPARRAAYERFWLRALGPFERVAPREDLPPLEVTAAAVRAARPVVAGPPHPAAPAAAEPTPPAFIVEPARVGALLARIAAPLAPGSACRVAPAAVFHTASSTSCTSKKSRSFQSAAATRQARTMSAPAGPRRNAAAARSARLACAATAAACGACTGRSARPPGSIRCTAASRAAAAGGGASAGAASQPSAAAAASSSQAASASSASALRSGSGNPGVATRVSPLS